MRRFGRGVRGGPRRRSGLEIAIGLAVLAAAIWGSADAEPQRTAWSTFLRDGPGAQYPAIDELEHDTRVDVLGEAGRWRKVRVGQRLGYIDEDALGLPRTGAGPAPVGGAQGCFVSAQDSYRQPGPTRFCEVDPRSQPAGR